jgi:DNA-binding GntR family transcriptional regulator
VDIQGVNAQARRVTADEWAPRALGGALDLVPETIELKVTKLLREAIIRRELAPTDKLRIHQLSERLGLSATPVANALKRLEVEGYVEIAPRRGFRVVPLSRETLEELVVQRVAVEAFAVRLAIPLVPTALLRELQHMNTRLDRLAKVSDPPAAGFHEADQEFHLALYGASGRRGLTDTIVALRDRCRAYMHMAASDPEHLVRSQLQHWRLLACVEASDVSGGVDVITEHINDTYRVLAPKL